MIYTFNYKTWNNKGLCHHPVFFSIRKSTWIARPAAGTRWCWNWPPALQSERWCQCCRPSGAGSRSPSSVSAQPLSAEAWCPAVPTCTHETRTRPSQLQRRRWERRWAKSCARGVFVLVCTDAFIRLFSPVSMLSSRSLQCRCACCTSSSTSCLSAGVNRLLWLLSARKSAKWESRLPRACCRSVGDWPHTWRKVGGQ